MTLVAASVTVFLPGLMLPGTIVVTQVGVLLAMVVLIDFQTVVISPDDYDVLAHQPVSSGTYFLVKLTNVLIFTLIIGALLGGPSVILLFVAYGPLVAVGGAVALVGVTMATTLAILCTYAALLNVVHPRRLVRVLSTVQMIVVAAVMLFPIYIDNLFGPALERMMSGDGAIPTPAWVLLAPPAWFASLLPLSAGDWNPGYAAAAVAGVGSVGVLFFLGAGKLSVSYAERLGAITTRSERRRRSRRLRHASGRRPLTRRLGLPADIGVIVTLVRAQFRDDMTFRMAVMGLVPAILIYSFLAMRQGPLPDPFVELGAISYGSVVMNVVVIGFPLMVADLLSMTKSWRASWIFFTLPADRARLVVNAGLCVSLFLVAPTALVIGGVLFLVPWKPLARGGARAGTCPAGPPGRPGAATHRPAPPLLTAADEGRHRGSRPRRVARLRGRRLLPPPVPRCRLLHHRVHGHLHRASAPCCGGGTGSCAGRHPFADGEAGVRGMNMTCEDGRSCFVGWSLLPWWPGPLPSPILVQFRGKRRTPRSSVA